MSKVLITEQYLSDIGSAIRAKAGTSEAFRPAQMASAIEGIGAGGHEDGIIDRTISGSYENSKVAYIGSYVFRYCTALTAVSFPNVTSIGIYAFSNCTALTTISFPNVISIGDTAFYNCESLTVANFPSATSIGNSAFHRCGVLTTASFPAVKSIGIGAFRSCYNLLSLYLLGSSIPTLSNANAFSSTPISNYTTSTGGVYGSIYVPSSLYNDYIHTANWAAFSSRFVSV